MMNSTVGLKLIQAESGALPALARSLDPSMPSVRRVGGDRRVERPRAGRWEQQKSAIGVGNMDVIDSSARFLAISGGGNNDV